MPFEPKGDVAEWRLIYDEVRGLAVDEVLLLERLEEVLGRPVERNRTPVYRAIRELERNHHRTLATIRGVGYRVAKPDEHLGLGLAHSSRARSELRRGLERSESADRSKLDPSVTSRLEAFESTTSRLVEFLGHMSKTVDQHASQIAEVRRDSQGTADRVEAVERALREHGMLEDET